MEDQNAIIRSRNKDITDAITYAKHIQDGILPSSSEVTKYLPNSFVHYQPKSIVSGDFYWMHNRGNEILFSVADCTGHGVPGAFMSMMGVALLNEIVSEHETSCPQEIINLLRDGIIKALNKGREEYKISDGMDACLCSFDKSNNVLQFSGANNSLYVTRKVGEPALETLENELIEPILSNETHLLYEIKGDKQPIGYYDGKGKPFRKTILQLCPNDHIYLSSDGFQDQIGGPKGKKFLTKRFKELILSLPPSALSQQKEILSTTIANWMEPNFEQTDDICIWGVKV